MKKTILIAVQILTLFLMCSCADTTEATNLQYENQLYGSLESNFKYYYSMDLWSLEQIVIEASSITADSDEQYYHLDGKIDGILDYSPYYSNITTKGQEVLSEQIISGSLNIALGAFYEAKTNYLKTIDLDIKNDRVLIKSEDFKQNCSDLASILRYMNVDITQLDRNDMNEYINQMNSATELMGKIIS